MVLYCTALCRRSMRTKDKRWPLNCRRLRRGQMDFGQFADPEICLDAIAKWKKVLSIAGY